MRTPKGATPMKAVSKYLAAALLLASAAVLALTFQPARVSAHGGEDHGGAKPAADPSIGPRVEAQSDLFEIVGVPTAASSGQLTLHVSDFATNRPVAGATIEVTRGDETVVAAPRNGLYEIAAPWVLTPGHYDLTFSVTAGTQSDLLVGSLAIPEAAAAAAPHESIWDHLRPMLPRTLELPGWAPLGGFAAMAGLAALALFSRGALRGLAAALAGLAGLATAASAGLVMTNGASRGAAARSAIAAPLGRPESPRRADDGAVVMPKPTQRLLDVQTLLAEAAETTQKTIRLIGHVIPDPNKSGLVQATLAGRVEPPETGFPAIGASVTAGTVLGYLVPSVQVVDRSDIAQTAGDLDRQITLAEAKLSRLERIKNVVAAAQIGDARLELDGLRERRAAIRPVLGEREALRAPVDGLVAEANAVSGQVVEAQTVLFQIVDPAYLWVEALAFDPAAATSIENGSQEASAATPDGRTAALAFAGRGLALRQQAVPLRFKVETSSKPLNVGDSVTVLARVDEAMAATPLPRSSVVRSGAGQSIVWVHAAPERF